MLTGTTITIIICAAVLLLLIGLAVFFAVKAMRLSKIAPAAKFSTMAQLQNNYERIRKHSRIPCSVLLIDVLLQTKDQNFSPSSKEHQAILERISQGFLATFGRISSNMLASVQNKEFVILTNMSESEINKQLSSIQAEISDYCYNAPIVKSVQMNAGIYLMPASVVSFNEALERCRLAYKEAVNRKDLYLAWDYNLQKAHDNAVKMDESFLSGLEKNKFFIELQPVVDIETGHIYCAEALTRLNRENVGILKPADFLSTIESMGIYDSFDYMIFEKTCKWLATHRGILEKINHVSVNFSRSSIGAPNFVDKICEIIEQFNLPFTALGVEILEDKADPNTDPQVFLENVKKLQEKGIPVLLDDFGAGFTSFDDIRDCSFDVLKTDRSIIQNTESDRGKFVVSSIVNMAKEIGATVICEGVETPTQLEIIKSLNCRYVQGYYFYRPMGTDQFEKLLKNSMEAHETHAQEEETAEEDEEVFEEESDEEEPVEEEPAEEEPAEEEPAPAKPKRKSKAAAAEEEPAPAKPRSRTKKA